MPPTDREVLDAFERRYGGIDAEIPPTPAFAPSRRAHPSRTRFLVAAGAAIVVVALAAPLLGLLPMAQNPQPSKAPNTASSRQPDAAFPTEVQGMQVISVARAVELVQSGRLHGRAVAVAGYYAAFYPSCPPRFQYVGPLERYCSFTAFADTADGARLCTQSGDSTTCHQPTGISLSPFFKPETAGSVATILAGGGTYEPAALVLIGHAGDPRQWQCTAETQAACADAFVVDRVAWAEGRDVHLAAPETGDQQTGAILTPSMPLDQVIAAAGVGDRVVTAAAFRSGDLAIIDPRITFVGDNLLWLVRSVGDGSPSSGDETRPELVWLVDDGSGHLSGPWPLVDSGYVPARIWQSATVHGYECCGGDLGAYSRIDPGGGPVHQGTIPGGAMGDNSDTVFGGGYGSTPLVLPAGTYDVLVWVASRLDTNGTVPDRSCDIRITFESLASYAFNADFPPDGPCTIRPTPVPSGDDAQ